MAQFVNIYPVDLQKGPVEVSLNRMYMEDIKANRVGVTVTDGGAAVTLGGTCSATAILSNGTLTFSGSTYQSQISKDGKIDPATGETDEGWLFTHSGSYEITGLYISCYETGNPRAVVHISVVNSTDRQIEATITESNAREVLHVMLER